MHTAPRGVTWPRGRRRELTPGAGGEHSAVRAFPGEKTPGRDLGGQQESAPLRAEVGAPGSVPRDLIPF